MFVLAELKDTVTIFPWQFKQNRLSCITQVLNKKFANKVRAAFNFLTVVYCELFGHQSLGLASVFNHYSVCENVFLIITFFGIAQDGSKSFLFLSHYCQKSYDWFRLFREN